MESEKSSTWNRVVKYVADGIPENLGELLSTVANVAAVAGAAIAVYLWFVPGKAVDWVQEFNAIAERNTQLVGEVAENTQQVAASVDVIAASLPKWPKIGDLRFEYEYPRRAHFLLSVENLRNVEVVNFQAKVLLGGEMDGTSFTFDDRNVILPYENLTLMEDATREPWIENGYLAGRAGDVIVCISGLISGEQNSFFEYRRYSVADEGEISNLLQRSFSSEFANAECL